MNSPRPLFAAALFGFLIGLPPSVAQSAPNAPSSALGEDVTIKAITQEKGGAVYKLHGNAEIDYETYVIRADDIVYDSASGQVTGDGHMMLDGGPNDEHIEAGHGTYNIHSETGRFEHVAGGIGVRLRGPHLMLTSSSPFSFTGKVMEKDSPYHYVVYDGTVTSCELPQPKWEFHAHKVVVDVGGNAKLYRSSFRLHGVPVFYFPFATHPAERNPRESGFLLPNIGQSSVKGTILGESVYLALNRSMDATIGAEYFSLRGWAPQGEFRARPSDTSFINLNFFSVLDRGIGNPPVDQGGGDVRLSAAGLFHNFRGVADIDYLSSFVFRLAFNEVFTQAVNSEVKSTAFLSNTTNGYFYNLAMQRYQNFESTTPGDVVTILHAPSLELSSVDHQLGHSPFYWSYDTALEGLSRSEPSFSTAALVGRFDFTPALSLPLMLHGWSVRPELALRDTFYTQQLVPTPEFGGPGIAHTDAINRKSLQGTVEIRPPVLDRVFDHEILGRKWKHVIEPHVTYRYVTGINNFADIIRFDDRDILSDTNEIEYGIVNRLYAKRMRPPVQDCDRPGMPTLFIGGAPPHSLIPWQKSGQPTDLPCSEEPQVREIVTWELAQKYFIDPTFGGALISGQPNVLTTTEDLTGTAFLTGSRRLSPLISRLRVETSSHTDVEWDVDYDFHLSHINASTALVNYRVGPFTVGGGDAFLQAPGENILLAPALFNQFRLLLGYGYPNKRGFSAATNIGFDANLNFLQYASLQTTYNWDCCGISLEYRRFALGEVRNENQYRFTFALANIGAFGNLRRDARLF